MGKEGGDRRSIRLKGYDYAQPGAYFLTLVVSKRRCLLGRVAGQEMVLSPLGSIVKRAWEALPARFPTVELGAYVIMPNHLHGIIILRDPVGATLTVALTGNRAGMNPAPTEGRFGPKLGAIVGAFKSLTTQEYSSGVRASNQPVQKLGIDDAPATGDHLWQRNYYEHIIRNATDWNKIHLYIEANPAGWDQDPENGASSR